MDFSIWPKIENIIKNLSFLNSIDFSRKNNKNTVIKNYEQYNFVFNHKDLVLDGETNPITGIGLEGENRQPIEKVKTLELTEDELFLILKINEVYRLNGIVDFDFGHCLKSAKNHITNKLTEDWYECAAKDIVHVKESIDFFGVFEAPSDPAKVLEFNGLKEDINYYYRLIQGIKHKDKRGEVKNEFTSPYDIRCKKNIDLDDDKYEMIFSDFVKKLIEFFKSHSFKK